MSILGAYLGQGWFEVLGAKLKRPSFHESLQQVGAHGWSALSTPWSWVGHSRPNEQAKVEELTRQMLHSEPAERISVTDALVLCSAATSNIKNACFGANCADSDGRGGGIFCGSNPLI